MRIVKMDDKNGEGRAFETADVCCQLSFWIGQKTVGVFLRGELYFSDSVTRISLVLWHLFLWFCDIHYYVLVNHISQFRVRGQIEPLMLAFPLNRAEERLEVGGTRRGLEGFLNHLSKWARMICSILTAVGNNNGKDVANYQHDVHSSRNLSWFGWVCSELHFRTYHR